MTSGQEKVTIKNVKRQIDELYSRAQQYFQEEIGWSGLEENEGKANVLMSWIISGAILAAAVGLSILLLRSRSKIKMRRPGSGKETGSVLVAGLLFVAPAAAVVEYTAVYSAPIALAALAWPAIILSAVILVAGILKAVERDMTPHQTAPNSALEEAERLVRAGLMIKLDVTDRPDDIAAFLIPLEETPYIVLIYKKPGRAS